MLFSTLSVSLRGKIVGLFEVMLVKLKYLLT